MSRVCLEAGSAFTKGSFINECWETGRRENQAERKNKEMDDPRDAEWSTGEILLAEAEQD